MLLRNREHADVVRLGQRCRVRLFLGVIVPRVRLHDRVIARGAHDKLARRDPPQQDLLVRQASSLSKSSGAASSSVTGQGPSVPLDRSTTAYSRVSLTCGAAAGALLGVFAFFFFGASNTFSNHAAVADRVVSRIFNCAGV